MICSPMVMTGLREYFGSCITIEIRPPRNARNVRFEAVEQIDAVEMASRFAQ